MRPSLFPLMREILGNYDIATGIGKVLADALREEKHRVIITATSTCYSIALLRRNLPRYVTSASSSPLDSDYTRDPANPWIDMRSTIEGVNDRSRA